MDSEGANGLKEVTVCQQNADIIMMLDTQKALAPPWFHLGI